MLSLYNSLGLDGGSVSIGNKLLAVGNDVRGSFPQYDRTTLRMDIDEDNPNDQGINPRIDINQDGIAEGADLTLLLADWGLDSGQAVNPRTDINQDGIVDGADLTLLLADWGQEFDIPDEEEEEENEEEDNGEDDGGGDPPIVGVIQTINGLVYPTSRVNVKTSPALPMWIKERNV